MSAVWSVVIAFVCGVIGAVLVIVPRTTLNSLGLGFVPHHVLILIGVIALIIASAAVYNVLNFALCKPKTKASASVVKTAKKAKSKKSKKSAKKTAKKSKKKSSKKKRK